jgi:hypothetical protein
MVGFADDNTYHSLWIIGSVIIGLSMAAILGDLSYRCLSPRGFALDRGEFPFKQKVRLLLASRNRWIFHAWNCGAGKF